MMHQGVFPAGPMQQDFGPFDGVQMGGPIVIDDFHHQNNQGHHHQQQRHGITPEPYDDWDDIPKRNNSNKNANNNKQDKNKTNQQNKSSIDIKHEGYILEKVDRNSNWARVGKRAMPGDEKELQRKVQSHRLKTREGPLKAFEQLSSNQQGVINRLIAERKQIEKNPKADWVLAYVQRAGKWHWRTYETVQVKVILKRQGKDLGKSNSSSKRESKSYQQFEIIDLDELPDKKKGGNSSKQQGWGNDEYDSFDDRGVGGGNKKKKNKKGGQNRNEEHDGWNDHGDWNDAGYGGGGGHHGGGGGNDFPHPLPPPMHHNFPPQPQQQHPHPQAIPIPIHDQQFPPQMHGPPMPQHQFDPHAHQVLPPAPQPPLARRPSGRQQPQWNNPFHSDQFPVHDLDDSPVLDDDVEPYHPDRRELHRSKSTHNRRPSTRRRPSISARKFSELEDKVTELTSRIRDWQGSGGSDSASSQDSYAGSPGSSRYYGERDRDRNPSTPATSHLSRRGSLDRSNSQHRPRYRSRRYTDAEIDLEPGYTHRNNGVAGNELRRYRTAGGDGARRHRSTRPSVHHTYSVDDYPFGRAEKPRYLPAPPGQQMLGDFDERYDFEGGKDRFGRRGSYEEEFREGYEAARRDLRRQRSLGGRTRWD